jgi:VCBS repeat-containing protein
VVASNAFTDVDSSTLTYTATLADGSALSTKGLSFDAATRTISGTPNAAGTLSVKVTASDGSLTADDTFDIVVGFAAVGKTVTITAISNDTGVAGDYITSDNNGLTISASLSAALVTGEVLQYSRDNGTTWTTVPSASITGTSVSHADSGLTSTNTIQMRVANGGGSGQFGTAATQLVTIDASAPTQTVVITDILDNEGDVTGTVANNGTTDDTSLNLKGTVSVALGSNETVAIYDGSNYLGNATVSGNNWTFADTSTLANAQQVSYTAKVVDTAANAGPVSTAYTATVNTSVPSITINNIAGNAVTDVAGNLNGTYDGAERGTSPTSVATKPVISGTSSNLDGQTITVTLNGTNLSATVAAGGAWSVELTDAQAIALNHGNTYSVTAGGSSTGGKVATDTNNSMVVNTATPDIPTVVNNYSGTLTPTLTGAAQKAVPGTPVTYIALETGDTLTVTVGGATYTGTIGSLPTGITYNASTNQWSVNTATATATSGTLVLATGNTYNVGVSVSAGSVTKTDISTAELVINTANPTITLNEISTDGYLNAAEAGQPLTITGVTNAEVGSIVTLVGFGVTPAPTATVLAGTVGNPNTFQVTLTAAQVSAFATAANAGSQDFTATVVNQFGKSGSDAENVIIDVSAPTFATTGTDVATAQNENIATTVVVYDANATDAGGGAVSYTLAGTDAGAFNINASTGEVSLKASPNYESKASYSFSVVATDLAGNTTTKPVTLAINNVDEVAPTINSADTATAVNENTAANTVVYTATSTDTDFNSPATATSATYSLKAATGDAAKFTINSTTGAVTLTESPNFEVKPSYAFTVVATDATGNASEKAVTLAVNNVDEVAPMITSAATATAVNENIAANTVVYTAAATDTDFNSPATANSVTYSLKAGTGDVAKFSINSASGAVTLIESPDFEAKPSFTFTVVAKDAANNASEQAVSLAVTNVDEVAPNFTSAATATAIAENTAANTVVYTATSTDTDFNSPATANSVTYSLKAGTGDAAKFSINSTSGAVTLIESPDFETKPSYAFTVVATDAAGNASEKAVTLAVNNVNEAPGGVSDTASIQEAGGRANNIAGTNLASTTSGFSTLNVLANDTDVDSGDTKSVSAILKGTTGAATTVAAGSTSTSSGQSIVGDYGTLVIGADGSYTYAVNQDNASVQALNVGSTALNDVFTYTVKDAGGLTRTATLTVAVNGGNDAPIWSGATRSTNEDVTFEQQVSSLLAGRVTDVDSTGVAGIAIIQDFGNRNVNNGTWYWADSTQASWTAISKPIYNNSNAIFLKTTDYLRYVPNANADAATQQGNLVVRVADDSMPVTASGTVLNLSTLPNYWSAAESSIIVNLNPVNDAPVINTSTALSMTTLSEDATAPSNGNTTAGMSVRDDITVISDVDTGSTPFKGIAITSVNSNGTLHYSLDNGTTWQAAGALTTNALLLDNNSRVFFQPNANWNGTTDTAFQYRAWDQTNTTAVIKAGALVSISATGGSTAYSQEVGKVGITVTPVNDAPVIVTPANALTTLEDTATTFVISSQLAGKVTDVEGTALKGIVIVQSTYTVANPTVATGTWAYSTNGTDWVDFPTTYLGLVDFTKVMYLNASDSLRFTPFANNNGANLADLNFRAVDATFPNTASGTQVDVTGKIGGSGAVSQAGHFTVSVSSVNDAPTGAVTITGTSQVGQVLTAASTVADVDGLGTLTYSWYANGTVISGATGTTYTLVSGDVGKTITAQVNYNDGGGTAEQVTSSATAAVVAPVVLDLNRDGALTYANVIMDVNSDGVMDNTLWAGMQDGVLVWDKYRDGRVHDHSQYAFTLYGGKTDLEGLALGFDTNRDGVFNAQDEKFDQFMVWQDADQDGVSDAGEVRSLADESITQINLVSDGVQRTPAAGVTETGRSTASLADGGTMLVADVAFAYSTATETAVAAHMANQLADRFADQVADQSTKAAEIQNKPHELSAEEMAQLGLPELAASLLTGSNAELIAEELASFNLSGAGVTEVIDAVTQVAAQLTAAELASLGLTETGVAAVINAISDVASELPPAPEVCPIAAESSTYSLSNGQSLDLTNVLKDMSINGIVKGLELVDMTTDTSANVFTLNLADVLSMPSSDGMYKLILSGAANDKVMLTEGEWIDTGSEINHGGHNYALYTGTNDSSAQLLIDQHMLQS